MNLLKSKKISVLLCMLLISALILTGFPAPGNMQVFAYSYGQRQFEAKTTGYTSISLKWSVTKGANGYVLSRRASDNPYKVIKIINSPKTKTYHDQKLNKGTHYDYQLQAFKYVNGKRKNLASYLYTAGVAGVGKVNIVGDYLDFDTSKSIGLAIYDKHEWVYNVEVYRSTSRNKDYKKIAVTSETIDLAHRHGWYANFIDDDKSLKPKTSYYYKVRAISKVGKKTLYGPMSNPVLHTTVNRTPVFNTTVLTPEETTTKEFKVRIDSDKYNALARMHTVRDLDIGWIKKDQQTSFYDEFRIDRYSFDDVNYIQPEEYVSIPPGKTIYIYFTSNTPFSLPRLDELKYCYMEYVDREAQYCDDGLLMDLIENKVTRYTYCE